MANLDMTQPIYLVKGEAPRYHGDIEPSRVNDGDYLTNDPRPLDGLFGFDLDEWDGDETVTDEQSYEDWLTEIHVSDADGDRQQDRFGNWWYKLDDEWKLIDAGDGSLEFCEGIDGPDDLDGWEERTTTGYAWHGTVHPSWFSHIDYRRVKKELDRRGPYVVDGTAELIASHNWTVTNPDVHVDMSPRILASGVELIPLTEAVTRGLARFVAHGGIPVLEVLHYDYGRPQWRDVHSFRPGVTEYQNVSAARLPFHYDNQVNPICPPPNDIANWYVGYKESGYGSHVKWTLSPLGLDWTNGGQENCTLDEGAYIVGAIHPKEGN